MARTLVLAGKIGPAFRKHELVAFVDGMHFSAATPQFNKYDSGEVFGIMSNRIEDRMVTIQRDYGIEPDISAVKFVEEIVPADEERYDELSSEAEWASIRLADAKMGGDDFHSHEWWITCAICNPQPAVPSFTMCTCPEGKQCNSCK